MSEAPLLEGELLGQYRIFLEVAKNRNYTQGGALPLHDGALLDYFEVNGVPEDEWSEIRDFVSRLDALWLEDQREEATTAQPAAASKSSWVAQAHAFKAAQGQTGVVKKG